MKQLASFALGAVVHHKLFDYRGVVFDVDPVFQGSDEWYEEVALSRPPKDEPWYHVLVDGKASSTYVAESNLELDLAGGEVDNPAVTKLFRRFEKGIYRSSQTVN